MPVHINVSPSGVCYEGQVIRFSPYHLAILGVHLSKMFNRFPSNKIVARVQLCCGGEFWPGKVSERVKVEVVNDAPYRVEAHLR